jgi:hypothetical protein
MFKKAGIIISVLVFLAVFSPFAFSLPICRVTCPFGGQCPDGRPCVAGVDICPAAAGTACGTDTLTCPAATNCSCDASNQLICDTGGTKTCNMTCNVAGNCQACAGTLSCDTPSHQGTDANGNGVDAECGDINDNNNACSYLNITPCATNLVPNCYGIVNQPVDTVCGTRNLTCANGANCQCVSGRYQCDTSTAQNCNSTCDGAGVCADCSSSLTCQRSNQGANADGDGFDAECGDCNDNNSLIYPDDPSRGITNPNPFLKCNAAANSFGSTTGIPETTDCHVDATATHFLSGCLCMDGIDNNGNGLADANDPGCPDLTKDWYIDGVAYTLPVGKSITGGIWVVNGATLTIPAAIALDLSKNKGLHVDSSSRVDVQPNGRVGFSN